MDEPQTLDVVLGRRVVVNGRPYTIDDIQTNQRGNTLYQDWQDGRTKTTDRIRADRITLTLHRVQSPGEF